MSRLTFRLQPTAAGDDLEPPWLKPHVGPTSNMKDEAERCAEAERFRRIDAAFRAGDLAALRAAVDDPEVVPNGPMPVGIGRCLEYAIYHSPLPFIRTLLDIGADPNPADHDGFPPLLAALSGSRTHPTASTRPDLIDVLRLLLECGADPDQRGINDYTALHMAVSEENLQAVEILLKAGSDPACRTRIDDCETPLEMARRAGLNSIVALLTVPQGR